MLRTAMTWEIVGLRLITSSDELSRIELEQLRIAGQHFDGEDRAPELRFVELATAAEGDDDKGPGEDPGCFASTGFLSASKIHVEGTHRFDLWCIDPDSASLFVAGTTELVAGRCQSTWMTPDLMDSYENAAMLDEAMHSASIW